METPNPLKQAIRRALRETLRRNGGDVEASAVECECSPRTLRRWIAEHELWPDVFRYRKRAAARAA